MKTKCVDCGVGVEKNGGRKRCDECRNTHLLKMQAKYNADYHRRNSKHPLADTPPVWEARFWYKLLKNGAFSLDDIKATLAGNTPYRLTTQKEFRRLIGET